MRLLTMLLMMCISLLSAADAQLKCDRSLINGSPGTFQFDDTTKTLTCIGRTQSLMMIHLLPREEHGIKSLPLTSLKCDETKGWTNINADSFPRNYVNNKIADASDVLNIACVEHCAVIGTDLNVDVYPDRARVIVSHSPGHGLSFLYHGWRRVRSRPMCSPYEGWHEDRGQTWTLDTTVPQDFANWFDSRVPPCTVTGTSDNVDIFTELDVNVSTRKLTCRSGERFLALVNLLQDTEILWDYESLECDEVNGWKSGRRVDRFGERKIIETEAQKIAEANTPLTIYECAKYCVASGDEIIYEKDGRGGAKVKCPKGASLRHPEFAHAFTSAKCELGGTWIFESANIHHIYSDSSANFECRPNKCYMPNVRGTKFNKFTKTLTCDATKDALMAIQVNSALYASVVCDEVEGWKGIVGRGQEQKLAEATSELNVTCVKYCESSGEELSVDAKYHPMNLTVSCVKKTNGVFRNGTRLGYKNAVCDLKSGWHFNEEKISDDIVTPLPFFCERACKQNVLAEDVHDFTQPIDNYNEFHYNCGRKNGYEYKTAIRVNGEIVQLPLSCHIDSGYTNATGSRLAGPFDVVKVDCETGPTTAATTKNHETTTRPSKTEESQAQSSVVVVVGSIGGVLLVIIIIVVIFVVLKKKRPENSENGTDKSKGRSGKHHKGNDKSGTDQPSSGQ